MTASPPPRLTTWLLRRFLADARHEALIGDLVEEYRAGRSFLWYWRQVLVAIVESSWKEIQTHQRLALRALGMTFVLYHLLWVVAFDGVMAIQQLVFQMFAGPHGLPWWPAYFDRIYLVLLTSAGIVTGWSVARLHRPHHIAMGLLCGMALPFLELPLFVAGSVHDGIDGRDVVDMATIALLGMVGTLIGGLLVHRSVRSSPTA